LLNIFTLSAIEAADAEAIYTPELMASAAIVTLTPSRPPAGGRRH